MPETEIKSRKWQITLNNPQPKGYTHEKIKAELHALKSLKYYCMSDEIGNTHHTHIYVCFSSPVRFSTLKNRFPQAHLEKAYGSSNENKDYIYKDGKWVNDKKKEANLADTHEEWGTLPEERQGARNDYAELYELIQEGKSNFAIIDEKPDFINQLERIDRVRQIVQEEAFKEIFRNLSVSYFYGETGSGKTRSIMENFGYSNVYRVTNYKHPFDQYQGQDVIVFEEFQSSLPINQMLIYLDGYPIALPCRYADKIACYTKVYILSNIDIREQYTDIQHHNEETWKAFLRRINTIKVFTQNNAREYTVKDYFDAFRYLTEKELQEIPFDNHKDGK
ncbi:MAG: replication protein [Lachnospiraceae bacterium]|nr:replication protein [Lachnospiraceae bacterium]